ncbi:signal transduction histidine kinase [Filimonas zeae]|uniref:histidine kinase n=1 Tax=Filimonas zeae TaxID=1737353 RepID=A0A917ITI8_9BACT|nr:ATP-binding protein [Filimonas zeae]MDR6338168.1 signal transduction histidine kinase [Filimonas zeae]GGH62058.1 hypothetical protein GCM10011379_11640 [Filimonas zeae]
MKTTIHQLVRKELPLIDAYTETDTIKDYLINSKALLVVTQQKPIGLLTTTDLAKNHQPVLADALVPKPFVQAGYTVAEVMQIMKLSGFTVLPVQDENGNLTGAIYIEDIVQYLYQQNEKQQAVVQTMAHDLKSPLANISSINEMLKLEGTTPENQELLNYVSQSVDLAREIINDLLLSEKLETDDIIFTRLELNEFIRSCIPPVQGLLSGKMITLETQMLTAPCYFMGDKVKLHRVMHNLLSNAIKFSNYQSTIRLSCFAASDNFTIHITDEGVGIPENLQPHVFDKFSKAQRRGTAGEGSTGLGMYITREIVKMHRGDIWFKSEERVGSAFYIRLPFHPFAMPL